MGRSRGLVLSRPGRDGYSHLPACRSVWQRKALPRRASDDGEGDVWGNLGREKGEEVENSLFGAMGGNSVDRQREGYASRGCMICPNP